MLVVISFIAIGLPVLLLRIRLPTKEIDDYTKYEVIQIYTSYDVSTKHKVLLFDKIPYKLLLFYSQSHPLMLLLLTSCYQLHFLGIQTFV